ncbi:hypothetical protein LVD17_21660 [Fulvivirga ulvae]|uniref:hypothetical protein n=1 Tax=Fulvivirga ulvae TaxID=2904245 RepID=UPI001F211AC6|nr:hypothetical protein [Fulvivirga ulvae]UII30904.1 hypothetical protein LVD17_21660 [Fulvivirga ulvae]
MKSINYLLCLFLAIISFSCHQFDEFTTEQEKLKSFQRDFTDKFEPSISFPAEDLNVDWTSYEKFSSYFGSGIAFQISLPKSKKEDNGPFTAMEKYMLVGIQNGTFITPGYIVKVLFFKSDPPTWKGLKDLSEFHGVLQYYDLQGKQVASETYLNGDLYKHVLEEDLKKLSTSRAPDCGGHIVTTHHYEDWYQLTSSGWLFLDTKYKGSTTEFIHIPCEDYDWDPIQRKYWARNINGGNPPTSSQQWKALSNNQTVGRLCDNIKSIKVGNSYTAQITGVGLTAVNHQLNKVVNAELGTICVSIPIAYATSQYTASQILTTIINQSRDEIGPLLNSGNLAPYSSSIRIKLKSLISTKLSAYAGMISSGPCSGSIPNTTADYSC